MKTASRGKGSFHPEMKTLGYMLRAFCQHARYSALSARRDAARCAQKRATARRARAYCAAHFFVSRQIRQIQIQYDVD